MTRVVFLGSKRVGLRCLEAMIDCAPRAVVAAITIDDTADVRTAHREFQELSARRDLPLHTVGRRMEVPPLVEEYQPDLCIVVGWYWLIPEAMMASVRLGFVGIHFSLLPLYRGSSPLVWAMIHGERETGVSMFTLVKDVDAGDLWGQRRIEILPGEYIGTVLLRLEDEASTLIKDVFPQMLRAEVRPVPQDHSRATYCSPRSPEDGVIDWDWSAERVLRFIRAQSKPYPGAFTHVDTDRLTIWRADSGGSASGRPGDVIWGAGECAVVCGDGKVAVVQEAELRGITGPLAGLIDASTLSVGSDQTKR